MAGERLRFAVDSMADVARDRGDGHGEKRQSEVGSQERSHWPNKVHQQVVRCIIAISISHFVRPMIFATEPNNKLNGNIVHARAEGIGNSCSRFLTLHMLENREFYNQATSFNGTSGMGRGTLASRPATCSPRTAYFATDTSTLYQCSSANTWTSYYTPYTYPHPLRGAAPAVTAPPTNLSAIVN